MYMLARIWNVCVDPEINRFEINVHEFLASTAVKEPQKDALLYIGSSPMKLAP